MLALIITDIKYIIYQAALIAFSGTVNDNSPGPKEEDELLSHVCKRINPP